MKHILYILPVLALISVTGCSTELSQEDRELLTQTRDLALEAKQESVNASKKAEMAAKAAAEAKIAAENASKSTIIVEERQDRMFHYNNMK